MPDLSHLKVDDQKRPDELDDDVRLRRAPDWVDKYAVADDGRVFSYVESSRRGPMPRELSKKQR